MSLAVQVMGLGGSEAGTLPPPTGSPWVSLTNREVIEAEVCVYGGTSGGVIAAVQAARMGKRVVVVEPGRRAGGLAASGLGVADVGNSAALGGLAREVYQRMGRAYGEAESFRYEPHVAEAVFLGLLREHDVPVYFQRVVASVIKSGRRITQLHTDTGERFQARVFIDASYEADLMARAGIRYVVGREATNTYGESLNGAMPSTPTTLFRGVRIDPYRVPGDAASGLLPLIEPDDGTQPGQGDARVQAFNFRLCLTQEATNRLPILPPAGYSEARYELLGRYIDARVRQGDTLRLADDFLEINPLPNGKADINSRGSISTDYVGGNTGYVEATAAVRQQVARDHESYLRGLLYYLSTSPRVPLEVREAMSSWGLCRDEFVDNAGWPPLLYVRESRRMVSDYVMTQADCEGKRAAQDSIALATYGMESHAVRRMVYQGFMALEGGFYQPLRAPYPISYRSLIPRTAECDNLLVTFCLSASHPAFCSYRLEPGFMVASQSAGAAASFAVDADVPLEAVDVRKLQLQLTADGQVLYWNPIPGPGVVLDNTDAGVTLVGSWFSGFSTPGYYGVDYLTDGASGKGSKQVRYTPVLPATGPYEVLLRWAAAFNRATNAPVDILHDAGTNTVLVNQRTQGGEWVSLGGYQFTRGTPQGVVLRTAGTEGNYVIADAVWLRPLFDLPETPLVNLVASDPYGSRYPSNAAIFTVVRDGFLESPLTVHYEVGGTGSNGVHWVALSGQVVIPARSNTARIAVMPLASNSAGGARTISLTLIPAPAYEVGALSNAVAVVHDRPFEEWRQARFSAADLLEASISGESSDPDGDGLVNLVEYAVGEDPRTPRAPSAALLTARVESPRWLLSYPRLKSATDLVLELEYSADLISWNATPPAIETIRVFDEGVRERVQLQLQASPDARLPLFVRLRVRLMP